MKRRNIGSALAIEMLVGIAGTANAAMIYNNGGPNTQTGLPIKGVTTADDFTLAASAAISECRFLFADRYRHRGMVAEREL